MLELQTQYNSRDLAKENAKEKINKLKVEK